MVGVALSDQIQGMGNILCCQLWSETGYGQYTVLPAVIRNWVWASLLPVLIRHRVGVIKVVTLFGRADCKCNHGRLFCRIISGVWHSSRLHLQRELLVRQWRLERGVRSSPARSWSASLQVTLFSQGLLCRRYSDVWRKESVLLRRDRDQHRFRWCYFYWAFFACVTAMWEKKGVRSSPAQTWRGSLQMVLF